MCQKSCWWEVMTGHQRQSWGHGEKRQEEHEQAGETQNMVPASAFYTCEDKSATPGRLLRGCPCAAACSANCQPSLLAKAFQAPLGALWKSRLLRRSSVNILLRTMFMTSCFVWLFSMNRKLDLHVKKTGTGAKCGARLCFSFLFKFTHRSWCINAPRIIKDQGKTIGL